jgi:hypothetical protein
MLSKCLHPVCSAPFRYLREGRVFHLEIPSTEEARTVSSPPGIASVYVETAAPPFTVLVKDDAGTVQARFLELVSGEHAEQAESEKAFLI